MAIAPLFDKSLEKFSDQAGGSLNVNGAERHNPPFGIYCRIKPLSGLSLGSAL